MEVYDGIVEKPGRLLWTAVMPPVIWIRHVSWALSSAVQLHILMLVASNPTPGKNVHSRSSRRDNKAPFSDASLKPARRSLISWELQFYVISINTMYTFSKVRCYVFASCLLPSILSALCLSTSAIHPSIEISAYSDAHICIFTYVLTLYACMLSVRMRACDVCVVCLWHNATCAYGVSMGIRAYVDACVYLRLYAHTTTACM